MKKIYFKGCIITKLNDYLKTCYNSKYLITINGDILGHANTLTEAKKIIIKEL